MGWRGALRSMNAIARAAERDARRRQKILERNEKESLRLSELDCAKHLVEVYENLIERLTSMHKECGSFYDWSKIACQPPPEYPAYANEFEQIAKKQFDKYKPSLFDRLFNKVEERKKILSQQIVISRDQDKEINEKLSAKYDEDKKEWEQEVGLAKSILAKDSESYLKAVYEIQPFKEISLIGSDLDLKVVDKNTIKAFLNVHGNDVIPKESYALLKTGKLSKKNLPKGQRNQLYQDYVCSCIVRVAREIFAILPLEKILITACDDLLNPATGFLEKKSIVSVLIPRRTIEKLNLDLIDPSECMNNFIHNMKFTKASGFAEVEEVSLIKMDEQL